MNKPLPDDVLSALIAFRALSEDFPQLMPSDVKDLADQIHKKLLSQLVDNPEGDMHTAGAPIRILRAALADKSDERVDVALGAKLDKAAAAARNAFYTSSESPVHTGVPYDDIPEAHKAMWRNVAAAARDAFGTVVLTRDARTDELVAVTRQDDDGRILSVIWEKAK